MNKILRQKGKTLLMLLLVFSSNVVYGTCDLEKRLNGGCSNNGDEVLVNDVNQMKEQIQAQEAFINYSIIAIIIAIIIFTALAIYYSRRWRKDID